MLQYWYVFPLAILLIGLCVAQVVLQWRREAAAKERELAEREQRAGDGRLIRCLIPFRYITEMEKLHPNAVFGGVFQPLHREAVAIGNSAGIEIEAKDQLGTLVTVTKVAWPELSHFHTEELSIKKQLRDSFIVGIGVGLGLGCLIVGIVLYKAGLGPLFQHPVRSFLVLAGLLAISPALGLLFSFVPNLFRLRSDLLQFVLHKTDGTTITLALDPTERTKGTAMLGEFKLPRRDS